MYISHYPINPSDLFPKDLVSGIGAVKIKPKGKSRGRKNVHRTFIKSPRKPYIKPSDLNKRNSIVKNKKAVTVTSGDYYIPSRTSSSEVLASQSAKSLLKSPIIQAYGAGASHAGLISLLPIRS